MAPGVCDSKVTPPIWTRPHRDEGEPFWVGAGGLGQEGFQFPALWDVPTPAALTNATCPLQKGCRRWQCPMPAPPRQSMLDTSHQVGREEFWVPFQLP